MKFNAGLIYETLNGAWSIALGFMVVFVLFYLREIARSISLRTFLFNQTLPEQFAVAIFVADAGNLIVRGATWAWRATGSADLGTLGGPLFWAVVFGGVLGTLGILCKLRVVSIARFGHWPWATCLACVLMFVAYQIWS